MMNLSAEQIQLAMLIDAHVSQYPAPTWVTSSCLPRCMIIWTPSNASWTVQRRQMDYLCQQYTGVSRFGLLLESLAKSIAEKVIKVPKDH